MKKALKNNNLKKLKNDFNATDNDEKKVVILNKIIKSYPKDVFGYENYIKLKTNNYSKYLKDEQLKDIKNIYDLECSNLDKLNIENLKKEYNDYIYDIKEVNNLVKIKKELVAKKLMNLIFNDNYLMINEYILNKKSYNDKGTKIKNIYDLINGIFMLVCLIFNIISPNLLLLITIPFGIYGLISVYNFIEFSFLNKDKNNVKETYDKDNILKLIKSDLNKNNEMISFLEITKKESISKIPEGFKGDLDDYINDNEEGYAQIIYKAFKDENIPLFTSLLESNTNLTANDIYEKISEYHDLGDDKLKSKKNISNLNKSIYMKNVNYKCYILLLLLLFISISSLIIIIKNFNEVNYYSFIIALIIGIIKMFIYNIDSGKHGSIYETFSDNLISVVFVSSLVYDLIYSYISNDDTFTYLVFQMPISFLIIFSGFVMLISLLKYNHLLKKIKSN